MTKGFFTQGLVILLGNNITTDELGDYLVSYKVVKRTEASKDWQFSGPALIVEYRPEVNGYVSIDVVGNKWPDYMGDPKQDHILFAAWSMGHFGPYAYPYGLRRSCEQSWRWDGANDAVDRHNAFIRIRLSYVFGVSDNAPVMPSDYNPEHELCFLIELTQELLKNQAAIGYFNPNGEVLLDRSMLADSLRCHTERDLLPFNLLCNIRLYKISEGWSLMDSVGNWQLDIPDIEAGFPNADVSPQDVDNFIRNASFYILKNGNVIKDGDTMDGAGDIRWQAKLLENGLCAPPRNTIRWLPLGFKAVPDILLGYSSNKTIDSPKKKPLWKFW
jgi:hypothetical protein